MSDRAFVDHHTHVIETAAMGDAPIREFVDGPRRYHERLREQGMTPMDGTELNSFDEAAGQRVRDALQSAAEVGLVQITEAGLPDWRLWDFLQSLRETEQLPLRVRVLVASGVADLQRMQRTGDDTLEMLGVKFYADGWLGPRTRAVSKPFADEPDNTGILFLDAQTLARRASPYAEAGWQIATHAIGDRAIDEVLDAYELIYGSDCRAQRPRIEHCQMLTEDIVKRMSELGVTACIQPSFASSDYEAAVQALGEERMKLAYRWDALLEAGVPVIAGNDYPIETSSPEVALNDAVNGRNASLSHDQALAIMTNAQG